jgi:predicted permease
MGRIKEFLRTLRYFLDRDRRSRELDDEMAFHQEMAERAGRPEARRKFGSSVRLQEQAREAWGWTWIDRLIQDLHYAARMLARSPGFTTAAVLVLALGMGTNVFMFTAMDWAFFQYLPVRDPDSLVRLLRQAPDNYAGVMSYPTAAYYREHAKSLSAVMTLMSGRLELAPDAKVLGASYVSANYFKELGASAAYGRLLDPALDEAPSESPAVVLGYEFWRRYFYADPAVVGKRILLNRQPATIVGVEPHGFPGLGNQGDAADVWLSIKQQPYFVAGSNALTDTAAGTVAVWARLAPGVTAPMAEQELLSLTNARRTLYPKDIWKGEIIRTEPAGHDNVLDAGTMRGLSIIAALGVLILVMTCANLGGLLLARSVAREHEVAIRIAIGANRRRIFRQLFTESLLLALLGSAAGLALGCASLKACLLYFGRPTWVSAAPDWRVCVFLLVMTFVAAIFFGLAPALQLARQQQKRTRARQVLIAVQVAASCLLVIISSLFVRSAQHVLYTDPGFGYEQVLSISPGLSEHGYTPAAAQAYLDKVESRLRATPGLASVSLVKYPPFGNGWIENTEINGQRLHTYRNWVDSKFFRTMDIPVLLGRSFIPGDKSVVIVCESLAHKLWPGENPLGKMYGDKWIIVGVVGNASINGARDVDALELYSPAQLEDMSAMSIVLKSNGAPDGLIPMLKSTVQSLDPKLFPEIRLLKSTFRENSLELEQVALLMSLVGVAATLLAGLGILGLVAYSVSQRTKEIAIRLALGSPKMQIVFSVLRQFAWPVSLGLIVGAAATAASSQVLRLMLFGISALDPLSYVTAVGLLLGVFILAALLPARRALRLDVAQALHQE